MADMQETATPQIQEPVIDEPVPEEAGDVGEVTDNTVESITVESEAAAVETPTNGENGTAEPSVEPVPEEPVAENGHSKEEEVVSEEPVTEEAPSKEEEPPAPEEKEPPVKKSRRTPKKSVDVTPKSRRSSSRLTNIVKGTKLPSEITSDNIPKGM